MERRIRLLDFLLTYKSSHLLNELLKRIYSQIVKGTKYTEIEKPNDIPRIVDFIQKYPFLMAFRIEKFNEMEGLKIVNEFAPLLHILLNREEKLDTFKINEAIEPKIQSDILLESVYANKELVRLNLSTVSSIALPFFSFSDTSDKIDFNFLTGIKNNKTIEELDLGGNGINSEGAKVIADIIKENTKIVYLRLNQCRLYTEGSKTIGKALLANTTLANLDISSNNIRDEGVKCILENGKNLKKLNLLNNGITKAGAREIANFLKDPNCKLEQLNISDHETTLVKEEAEIIAEALKENKTLKELYFRRCFFESAGAGYIAKALKSPNCAIACLDMSYTCISTEGCKELAESLKINNSLRVLNLGRNKIDEEGSMLLCEGLIQNSKIIDLCVGHNYGISSEGAKFFSQLFGLNSKINLEKLDICNNSIGDEGVKSISKEIYFRQVKSLKQIILKKNEIHDSGAEYITKFLLNKNDCLQELNLSDNLITGKGCTLIAQAIANNCSLLVLDLSGNEELGPEAGLQLGITLAKNTNVLQKLYLDNCNIGKEDLSGCKAIAESLKCNKTLKELHFVGNIRNPKSSKDVTNAFYIPLADSLKTNESLTTLKIGRNDISNAGIGSFFEVLGRENHSITHLSLMSCQLNFSADEPEHQAILEEMIISNDTLKFFDLRGAKITKEKGDEIKNLKPFLNFLYK